VQNQNNDNILGSAVKSSRQAKHLAQSQLAERLGMLSVGLRSPKRDAEINEELVSVLTAISVVSKRLAKKLALLEQQSAENGGERPNG
jgi:transcriptional regulator with XRE-family HTH domain